MTAVKKGDRVRVVLEGLITCTYGEGEFDIGPGVAVSTIVPDAPHVVSVEVLPPPEPEWTEGDVVRSVVGSTFLRTADGRWQGFSGNRYEHGVLPRPLTRLVPEGQS